MVKQKGLKRWLVGEKSRTKQDIKGLIHQRRYHVEYKDRQTVNSIVSCLPIIQGDSSRSEVSITNKSHCAKVTKRNDMKKERVQINEVALRS